MQKKWLYISPDVYVDKFSRDNLLLYNTANGQYIISSDTKLNEIVSKLYTPSNLGVIDAIILKHNKSIFIKEAFTKGILGIQKSNNDFRFINLLPLCFLHKDLDKNDIEGIESRLTKLGSKSKYISGIYLYLSTEKIHSEEILHNNEMVKLRTKASEQHPCPKISIDNDLFSCNTLMSIFKQLVHTSVTTIDIVLTKDFFSTFKPSIFIKLLNQFNYKYRLHVYIEDFIAFDNCLKNNALKITWIIYFDKFTNIKHLHQFILNNKNLNFKIKKLVYSASDINKENNNYIKQIDLSYLPVWTNENIDFFEKYVWINKKDILNQNNTMTSIFRNQKLNANFFGILDINSKGDIIAHGTNNIIGNYKNSNFSFANVISRELRENNSWRKTRNLTHCKRCPFRYLCPPISIFELQNPDVFMCHIVNNKN